MLSPAKNFPCKSRRNRSGFALIITIVLVAFLVLILVGLATFSRVETTVSGNAQSLAAARQNALMGLNLGLGELQRHAGLDKHNTARADIIGAAASNQPYLTGVWDDSGTLVAWLVSGNEGDPTGAGAGITPGEALSAAAGTFPVDDGASRVYLLGQNSVTNNADGVLVAKRPITAPAGSVPGFTTAEVIGHYAWWVGDEGIKVSASLIDPLLGSNPISYNNDDTGTTVDDDDWGNASKRERLNQLQLPRPNTGKIFAAFEPDLAASVAGLPLVLTRAQLGLVGGGPTTAQLKANFHNYTPLSRGVLVDTNTGKLREDLSADVSSTDPIPSYQKLRPDTVPVTTPVGVSAEFFPAAPPVGSTGAWPTYAITPPLTEAGLRFYFTADGANVVTNVILYAEIWNPYAATLKTSAGHTLRLRVTIPNELRFVVSDGAASPATPVTATITLPANTVYTADIDTTLAWQPGQLLELHSSTGGLLGTGGVVPLTSNTASAMTTAATVESSDTVEDLKFELLLVEGSTTSILQEVTLDNTTFTVAAATGAGSTAGLGYGYEFNRDLLRWTSVGTTPADHRDPRLPILNGTFNEPDATSAWRNDPSINTSGISGSGVLNSGARVVLFDLPRQEVTSVAQLRHIIGPKAYTLASSWGGSVNNRFDSEFVSTVPRNFAWPTDSTQPRPNRYLEIYYPEVVAPGEFSTDAQKLATLRSKANSSRYQLIRGAFNINSTSVEAWTAVLGAKLTEWEHVGSTGTGITLENAFFRVAHGAQQRPVLLGSVPPVPNSTDLATLSDTQLLGATGRQLGSTEVANLATEIVRLLKDRGRPFASLADFVNSGLIQNAIDNVALNSVIADAKLRYSASALTQGDVIACIAPFMAARSDTFIIRSYGDVRNPATGLIEGRVWCEATVQRVPDLVSDPAAVVATVIDPPAASNPFGRRLKIVSFRWLSSDDL